MLKQPPYPVKITVIKKTFHKDFVEKWATGHGSDWVKGSIGEGAGCCHAFDIGQEFVSDGVHMPEGFIDAAWVDIQKYVLILARGGNMLGVQEGVFVTQCSDGFRPVSFKLERIDD